jgi:hypothetical protein
MDDVKELLGNKASEKKREIAPLSSKSVGFEHKEYHEHGFAPTLKPVFVAGNAPLIWASRYSDWLKSKLGATTKDDVLVDAGGNIRFVRIAFILLFLVLNLRFKSVVSKAMGLVGSLIPSSWHTVASAWPMRPGYAEVCLMAGLLLVKDIFAPSSANVRTRVVTRYFKTEGETASYLTDQRPEREHHVDIKYEEASMSTVHREEELQLKRGTGWVPVYKKDLRPWRVSNELAAQHRGYMHLSQNTSQYALTLQRNIFRTSSINYKREITDDIRSQTASFLVASKLATNTLDKREDDPLN